MQNNSLLVLVNNWIINQDRNANRHVQLVTITSQEFSALERANLFYLSLMTEFICLGPYSYKHFSHQQALEAFNVCDKNALVVSYLISVKESVITGIDHPGAMLHCTYTQILIVQLSKPTTRRPYLPSSNKLLWNC